MQEAYWMTSDGDGTQERPYILWDGKEGLIILDDAGLWYTNQTGGVCCNHAVARGHFEERAVPSSLSAMLTDCCWGLSEAQAEAVDAVFARFGLPMHVDRDHLGESEEAWVHVVLDSGRTGILVWENSD